MGELDFATFLYIVNELGLVGSLSLLSSRIWSINHYYVLSRSTATAKCLIAVKEKMKISPIREEDIPEIAKSLGSWDVTDKKEVLSRLLFHRSGFKNGYVIRDGEKIAFMQWIIYPAENGIIRERYGKKFYPLGDAQVMIENALTFPPYRGLGYLSAGTQQLLDQARTGGYRTAVCYIRKDNIASLNEFIKMGFRIIKLVPEYKILGKVWRGL